MSLADQPIPPNIGVPTLAQRREAFKRELIERQAEVKIPRGRLPLGKPTTRAQRQALALERLRALHAPKPREQQLVVIAVVDRSERERKMIAARDYGLSPRIVDVLELVAQGLSNATIGARLYLGEDTIKTHMRRAMARMGARTRTDAVVMAARAGVIEAKPLSKLERYVFDSLSAREREVLALVAAGRSNIEIGSELTLSALTVKSHLGRIAKRLGTGDRTEMAMIHLRATEVTDA